jgi:hypothetical protein
MASAAVRARLEALKNDEPYHVRGGRAMYVGQPRIMLRDRRGNPTVAGQAWLEMGGRDPIRYQGELQRTNNTKYVMEDGKRHILQKLVQGPDGPNWELTSKGRLRMRELNEWEVMIPAIGHRYNKKRNVWETFSDQVVITDKELTRNTRAFGDRLDAEPQLQSLIGYTATHAVREREMQKELIKKALQAHWAQEFKAEWKDENYAATPGGDKHLVIARASDVYWTIDLKAAKSGEGFTYDWRASYVSDGHARTETILNRPLRGAPYVPIDMAYQMNLLPISRIDLDGFCAPIQMQLCVAKRSAPGGVGERDFTRSLEPEYCIEEMKEFLEQIHERVHGPRPGKQPTVHREPSAMEQAHLAQFVDAWARLIPWGKEKSLQWLREQQKHLRKPPFQALPSFTDKLREVYGSIPVETRYLRFFDAFFQVRKARLIQLEAEDEDCFAVRRRVPPREIKPSGEPGISAAVIIEFCKLVGYPCHVIHKDRKIYEWMPEGYETWTPDASPKALRASCSTCTRTTPSSTTGARARPSPR